MLSTGQTFNTKCSFRILFYFPFLTDKNSRWVNPQDKVVVVAVVAEKENMSVYIITHVMCALLPIIFEIYYHYTSQS